MSKKHNSSPRTRYQHLVFDVDGTLYNTSASLTKSINSIRGDLGLPQLTQSEVTKNTGFGLEYLLARVLPPSLDIAPIYQKVLEYYHQNSLYQTRPYPYVQETLARLPVGKSIISNKPEDLVFQLLEAFDMTKYFEFVCGGDSHEFKKPDRRLWQATNLWHSGLNPAQCLMVGDTQVDVDFARSVNMPVAICHFGFSQRPTIGQDYDLDDFRQLLSILALS